MCLLLSDPTAAAGAAQAQTTRAEHREDVALPPGRLADDLNRLARIYDVNLLVPADLIGDRTHEGLQGRLTLEAALELLLRDQGLDARFIDARSVAILATPEPEAPARPGPAAPVDGGPEPIEADTVRREDRVIVTGTRMRGRTVHEALAPIDVIAATELGQTASDELMDGLSRSLPNFTAFRLPLNDGNIFNRPTALRGLSSDQTLVLVNGKRRHRSAFLETSRGQPTDLSQVPVTLIGRVEVLRDGASAQYGSDAIGGVINIILDETDGAHLFVQHGQYFEGDGDETRVGFRTGVSGGGGEFAMLGFEAVRSAPTSRAVQRADAIAFQQAHPEIVLPDPVQRWGQPEREGWRVGLNGALPLSANMEGYAFGTLALSRGLSDFNWRNPNVSSAYKSSDAFPGFDLRDVYPAGFTPRFGQEEADLSVFAGIRSEDARGVVWDASIGFGGNRIDYILNNSFNPSLGPDSPTDFRPGRLSQGELVMNLDGALALDQALPTEGGQVSFGAEYRHETYEIEAGDPASYAVGPGALDGLPSGSNGFPGYAPDQVGVFHQDSVSAYADMEIAVDDALSLALAVRYEHYSLFGDTLNGKASARYEIAPGLALRGTVSTGFRAPTAGQAYSQRTSQGLDSQTLDSVTNGRFSPESPVARILSERPDVSVRSLGPETAFNLAAGVTYRSQAGLTVSIDAYRIAIDDEFGRSPSYTLSAEEREKLAGLDPVLGRTSNVYFFQNIYDQTSTGVDLVASRDWRLDDGDLSVSLAYSYFDKSVGEARYDEAFLRDQLLLSPNDQGRATLAASYAAGRFELYSRVRWHGEWEGPSGLEDDPVQRFGGRAFVDLSVSWRVDDTLSFRFGAENLFNVYPDPALNQSNRGLIYSRDSPYDTDGGLYYLRLEKTL
ncbi:hypothetical protein AY599_03205 [Leptolyngbya valderiana BDU 20041]|nr:hypothetical protein AY599_03205 [Leptolyngbya valderiana BDU 20041]